MIVMHEAERRWGLGSGQQGGEEETLEKATTVTAEAAAAAVLVAPRLGILLLKTSCSAAGRRTPGMIPPAVR